jgi:hypothetical protein
MTSYEIAGVNLFSQGLGNEYRISILERILDKIVSNNPNIKITKDEINEIKKATLLSLQTKYPEAGLTEVDRK